MVVRLFGLKGNILSIFRTLSFNYYLWQLYDNSDHMSVIIVLLPLLSKIIKNQPHINTFAFPFVESNNAQAFKYADSIKTFVTFMCKNLILIYFQSALFFITFMIFKNPLNMHF